LKNFPFAPEKAKTYVEKALLGYYQLDNTDIIRLKMGLGQHFKQRVLFILDGYDELGKGNNPNFSQHLRQGDYDTIWLSPKRPTSDDLVKDSTCVFLFSESNKLLFASVKIPEPHFLRSFLVTSQAAKY
jgi:hypothetical protein